MTIELMAMPGAGWASRLRLAWDWFRQVSGDAAYENYLHCARRRAADEVLSDVAGVPAPRLSRTEFYLDSLRRRYSTVSRCC